MVEEQGPRVILEPVFSQWETALREPRGNAQARAHFGLDVDRAVVMSGHQPMVFHGGILAKLIALDEAAKRTGAQAVWIVPDQDTFDASSDPGSIRLPMGSRESLQAQRVELYIQDRAHTGVPTGVPTGSLPAMEIVGEAVEHESVGELAQWLDQFGSMETLAQQFGYGVIEYACDRLGMVVPTIVFASQLMEVESIRAVIEKMIGDARRCVGLYNEAAELFPAAGVRALTIEGDRIELPMWGMRAGEARVAIDTDNVGEFEFEELVPRGLLMSALCRMQLADVFIHGLGGDVYDQISERWFGDWLGVELSPKAKVSADLRLDLGFGLGFGIDEQIDTATAIWKHQHSLHSPALVGAGDVQRRKDELVLQIETAPAKSDERDELYRALQALLVAYREQYSGEIAAFGEKAAQAKVLESQLELARDRTWAMVCFSQDELESLDRATREAMN